MLGSFGKHSQPSKKRQTEGEWFAVSFRPQNFLPGLYRFPFWMKFFLLDLSGLPKSNSRGNKTLSTRGKQQQQSLVSDGGDEELKMVLVVRQDLKMKAGKVASQCAHAATGIYAELVQRQRSLLRQWEQCGQAKIVVTCKNQQEMNKLKEAAESIGLVTFVLADAGRTQVLAGSNTVLAIGTALVDSVTGKLSLL
ncbi:hypothetical protein NE237_026384 [Protea cynaroides]|uniref:peptidyl-tRNA hydrolase n=1 Tax=Protea cynaroides TaxID=273540 RepID=A0A9Q0H6L4_9MAGN|nr:hypothetical protein NE237_026384 [Protea cynaroides]